MAAVMAEAAGRVAAAGPAVGGPSHLAKACMQSCSCLD